VGHLGLTSVLPARCGCNATVVSGRYNF
jgi:hypothetical protein